MCSNLKKVLRVGQLDNNCVNPHNNESHFFVCIRLYKPEYTFLSKNFQSHHYNNYCDSAPYVTL